jgi:hypothetical protein
MPKQKPQCSGTRGYGCGRSCISAKKICRKDGLSGQSVKLLNMLSNQVTGQTFNQQSQMATYELHFEGFDKQKSLMQNVRDYGIKDPKPTVDAIYSYSSNRSQVMKKFDAGIELPFDTTKLEAKVAAFNEFLEKAPKYGGSIVSGFKNDMKEVYGIEKLKVGSKFSFPSMTSFSSNKDIADTFNGGGYFIVNQNKSGASIKHFAGIIFEDEVVVPKSAKYKVTEIEGKNIYLEEI